MFKLAFALTAAAALAACSTGPYRTAVKTFADGAVGATGAADEEMSDTVIQVRDDAVEYGRLRLVTHGFRVASTDACADLILPKIARAPANADLSEAELIAACKVAPPDRPNLTVLPGFESRLQDIELEETRKLASALSSYADGLLAVTDSESYGELRTATGRLGTSLGKVSAVAGGSIGTAVSKVISPLVAIAGEVAIIGLENRRERLLRKTIPATHDAVVTLSAQLDQKIRKLRQVRLQAALTVFSSAIDVWNRSRKDDAAAAQLSQAVVGYRSVARHLQRPLPFSKLAEAHEALVALSEEDLRREQLEELFKRVGDFQDAAKDLKSALKELRGS